MPPVSRSQTTRESTTRDKPYKPPNLLDAPKPPPGQVYRWVRVSVQGQDDAKNISMQKRDGWVPVRAEEHPEYDAPVQNDGKYAGIIGVGDLVLCKNTVENVKARNDYLEKLNERQQTAVDNDILRAENPMMPIHRTRHSGVTTGTRKVDFQGDNE